MTPNERVVCKDGFSISIQADEYAYCEPRENGLDFYSSVELGFPSERPTDEVMEYAEDSEQPTRTVYGYVPVDVVYRLLEAHGGATPETCGNIPPGVIQG